MHREQKPNTGWSYVATLLHTAQLIAWESPESRIPQILREIAQKEAECLSN